MVLITEELIRKRSEHNECIISTLEELSLHQEDIEKIEHINNWCKDLQILYLQANLIAKIENLNKLKKLQYLNLAINNIETVENLERCESLEKLDLTLNFIGDIESVASLAKNVHLKDLYLMGNPCCDYEGYRNFVVAKLPQIENLDNTLVTRSERIKAIQTLNETERKVKFAQNQYKVFRAEQRLRQLDPHKIELSDDEFWKSASENCPEVRMEIAKRNKRLKNQEKKEDVKKSVVRCFTKDGKPLNINQAKLKFHFIEDNPEEFILELEVYKYLDTNLMEVDVQPIYVKVVVKGKIFQFVLPEEVYTDRSVAQRSQTTGHLVVRMPRVGYKPTKKTPLLNKHKEESENEQKRESKEVYLEVLNNNDSSLDFSKIVENAKKDLNSEIPPLQYL